MFVLYAFFGFVAGSVLTLLAMCYADPDFLVWLVNGVAVALR